MAETTPEYKISGRFAQGPWAHSVNELTCILNDSGLHVTGAGVEILIDTTKTYGDPIDNMTFYKGYGQLRNGGGWLSLKAWTLATGRWRIDSEDAWWFSCEVAQVKHS